MKNLEKIYLFEIHNKAQFSKDKKTFKKTIKINQNNKR